MAPPRLGIGRTLLIVVTIASLLLGAAVVAGVLLFDSYARDRVIEEARKRGVELDPTDVDVWFGSATVSDARFRLIGVHGLEGHVDRVSVLIADWKPTRFDAERVTLDVVGSAADLAVDLVQWTKDHPLAYRVPASARQVNLSWKPSADSAPWLVVQGGHISDSARGSSFTAERAIMAGVEVGAVGASWASEGQTVQLAFGNADRALAPVRADIAYGASPPTATVELKPTSLTELAGPLGVAIPLPGVAASGDVQLTLPGDLNAGPIEGHLHGDLHGYVPPHPVELNGFIFGDKTTLDTDLSVSPDKKTVTLTNTKVVAGSFELDGGGSIERQADHAVVRLALTGDLPCRDVADAAARARVGSVLGRLLGKTAKKLMTGSVGVRITVLADTRNLPAAAVERHIGIGCGLKPMSLEDLIELGVSEEAQELIRELPARARELPELVRRNLPPLPSGLPPLPSALPPIPSKLPPLPFELPKLPEQRDPAE